MASREEIYVTVLVDINQFRRVDAGLVVDVPYALRVLSERAASIIEQEEWTLEVLGHEYIQIAVRIDVCRRATVVIPDDAVEAGARHVTLI